MMEESPAIRPDPALSDAAAVACAAGVDPGQGLSSAEAARRLAASGPNEVRSAPPEPVWHRVLRQFRHPLVYLLLGAIVVSLAAWVAEGGRGVPVDVVVIAAILLANAAIGLVQERRAEDAVAALATLTAAVSTVLRDGRLVRVPSAELVTGDILVLEGGDAVGADARLLTATGLLIQEAALTGESASVTKDPAPLPAAAALADRAPMVYRGTAVVSGVGRAVVTATGMDTEIGAIAHLLDATADTPSPLEREIARISRLLGVIVLAIAATVMVALFALEGAESLSEAVAILLLGVSLAVAAVPEGLPAILSVVLAIGVQRLARRNAVMKSLHSVETLGAASVICSDKTGTLTRNEMTLRTIVTDSGEVELSGTGYTPSGGVQGSPDDATLHEARLLLAAGAIANNAQLSEAEPGRWTITGDPTEAAFLVAQPKLAGAAEHVAAHERHAEVPFSSERKLMSVASGHRETGVRRIFTKGAPDVLLDRCVAVQSGADAVALDPGRRRRILDAVARLNAAGHRTLGVAYRVLKADESVGEHTEAGLTFVGVAGLLDPARDEARDAVAQAHRAGIRVIMITGDHPVTAARIASDLGIAADAEALTGADLDALDDARFREAVRRVSVYARVAPKHKLRIVAALQADGQIVAMTGDGVNDAPALKAADIGVAMGVTGTEVTKEAGDLILGDDNFATIVTAVRQGRAIFDNITKFLRYLLSSNIGEVVAVFFGIVGAGVLGLADAAPGALAVPLLATQILWINLVTDSGAALAMGVDPESGDVMARGPRSPDAPIIGRALWLRMVTTGLVMGVATLITLDLFLPGGLLPGGTASLETARTGAFTTLVLAQLFNALNARSEGQSAFRHLFANRWLWASIAFAVLAQVAVVTVPALQAAFGTTALDAGQWAACVALASVVLWVEEAAKLTRAGVPRRPGRPRR